MSLWSQKIQRKNNNIQNPDSLYFTSLCGFFFFFTIYSSDAFLASSYVLNEPISIILILPWGCSLPVRLWHLSPLASTWHLWLHFLSPGIQFLSCYRPKSASLLTSGNNTFTAYREEPHIKGQPIFPHHGLHEPWSTISHTSRAKTDY